MPNTFIELSLKLVDGTRFWPTLAMRDGYQLGGKPPKSARLLSYEGNPGLIARTRSRSWRWPEILGGAGEGLTGKMRNGFEEATCRRRPSVANSEVLSKRVFTPTCRQLPVGSNCSPGRPEPASPQIIRFRDSPGIPPPASHRLEPPRSSEPPPKSRPPWNLRPPHRRAL
jgi:hypothetical protein